MSPARTRNGPSIGVQGGLGVSEGGGGKGKSPQEDRTLGGYPCQLLLLYKCAILDFLNS